MSVRGSRLLAAAAAVSLILAPAIADARVGGGSSSGSRGGNTNSAPPATRTAPGTAAPMERTMTPPAAQRPAAPTAAPNASAPAAAPARSGFMSGLAGGLIGAGIGSMLFSGGGGGGFFGHGLGFGGFLGFLLQIGVVLIVGRLIWKLVARYRQPAMAGAPGMFARDVGPQGGIPQGQQMGGGSSAVPGPAKVNVTPADFQAFEQLLQGTQAAWSARDLNALRGMATPEMAGYFAEQLADQTSRSVTNTVTNVHLDSGDLSEAWAENGREFATVAMRFSMIDVTKDGIGRVVEGSLTDRATVTEIWTFVRAQGGQWILSAIQQTR